MPKVAARPLARCSCRTLGFVLSFWEKLLFSHAFVGVSDFERALGFYSALLTCLGNDSRFCDRSRVWAGWQSAGEPRPLFLIGAPYDGTPHAQGNGQMVALGLIPTRCTTTTCAGEGVRQDLTPNTPTPNTSLAHTSPNASVHQPRSVCNQPAAAIVVRSHRCGPTICTPIGRPSGVVANGATVAGRPMKLARPAQAV